MTKESGRRGGGCRGEGFEDSATGIVIVLQKRVSRKRLKIFHQMMAVQQHAWNTEELNKNVILA